jgi:hypothetical protein
MGKQFPACSGLVCQRSPPLSSRGIFLHLESTFQIQRQNEKPTVPRFYPDARLIALRRAQRE